MVDSSMSVDAVAAAHEPHAMFVYHGGLIRFIKMTSEVQELLERIIPSNVDGLPFVSLLQRNPETYTVQYFKDRSRTEEFPRSSVQGQWCKSVLDHIMDPKPQCISNIFVARAVYFLTDAYINYAEGNTKTWKVPEDYSGVLLY